MTHYCISPGSPHRGAWTHALHPLQRAGCGPPPRAFVRGTRSRVSGQAAGSRLGRPGGAPPARASTTLSLWSQTVSQSNTIAQSRPTVSDSALRCSQDYIQSRCPRECEFRRGETLGLGSTGAYLDYAVLE